MSGSILDIRLNPMEENIKGQDKKKGRERAALLDSSLDGDGRPTVQFRGGGDSVEQPFDYIDHPFPNFDFLEGGDQEGVVNGVEGLLSVEKKNP